MGETLRKWFSPPQFKDQQKSQQASIVHALLLTLTFILSVLYTYIIMAEGQLPSGSIYGIIAISIFIGLIVLNKRGNVRLSAIVLILIIFGLISQSMFQDGGVYSPVIAGMVGLIAIAGVLVGFWGAIIAATVASIEIIILYNLQISGQMVIPPYNGNPIITYIPTFIVVAFIMGLITRRLSQIISRLSHNEEALLKSNQELQTLSTTLESQVTQRTRRLEIIAGLGERLNAVLALNPLLETVVNEVQNSFNYYHVQIYLLNSEKEMLIMRAGTGQAGAEMKAQEHKIALDASTSLVARAARNGEIVWIDNVRQTPDWLPNPLLPDTASEIAVPITIEGETVGVLDVQEDQIIKFDEGDVSLFRSLSNQVAIAVRNARLFAQVQQALNETRSVQQQYIIQSWAKTGASRDEDTRVDLVFSPDEAENQARKATLEKSLTVRDTAIGKVRLQRANSKENWNDAELALIDAVIDQVAQTAENLRLFDETRQRAGREQVTREIAEKMQQAPNLEGLVKIAADELGRYFSLEYAAVELGIEQDET